jgi:hypothetical protein
MVKVVIAVVLLAHGLGHSLGLLQMLKVATVNPAWRGDSWVLTGAIGQSATQLIGATLWIVAIIGFAALAAIVVGWLPESWFAPLAVGSAIVSLAGVALFPAAFPLTSSVGAVLVDVVVLVSATWFGWLPSELPQ